MTKHHQVMSRAFGATLAVALAVSACSGGDEGSMDAPADQGIGTTVDLDGGGTDGAATPTTTIWISPLNEVLGYTGMQAADPEETTAQMQESRDMEAAVSTCMQALGFEYTPVDPESYENSPFSAAYSLPADEFAATYGYGITTMDDLAADDATTDPNQALIEAMAIPERRAYYQALYGDAADVDENGKLVKVATASDKADADRAVGAASGAAPSCSQQASDAVYGTPEPSADEANDSFAALEESLSALYASVDEDQRVADASTEWSGCMADAGHPGLAQVADGVVEIDVRASEVMGPDRDASTADPVALATLRADEIAMAVDDLACQAPYTEVYQVVQAELEQAFIDANRDELVQYRAALDDGSAGQG